MKHKGNKEEKETFIINRKKTSRFILQIFVWILVVAFVSTIGVMWDTQSVTPVVIRTTGGTVDLSPRQLYMLEFNRLSESLKEQNTNMDPRILNKYITHTSLTNAGNLALRQQFYKEIKLRPSETVKRESQNSGLSANVFELQYAEGAYLSPLGVLSSIGSPTVSDIYGFNSLKTFTLATEIIVLNKTNFLMVKLPLEEQKKYYNQNIDKWLNYIFVKDFKVENRGQARKIIRALNENGLEEGIKIVQEDLDLKNIMTYSTNTILTTASSSFNHFMDVVIAYKNKGEDSFAVTEPIYKNGSYHVSIIEAVIPYEGLAPNIKREMMQEYMMENYDKLAKTYQKDWDTVVNSFKEQLSTNASFSLIASSVEGAVNHTTLAFSMLDSVVTNTIGTGLDLPILSDKEVLKSLLYTDEQEVSPLVDVDDKNQLLLAFRPLEKKYLTNINTENLVNDPELFQQVNTYKLTLLQNSLNDRSKQKRYKLKMYPEVLTNLAPIY